MDILRKLKELAAPEVLAKMSHPYIGSYGPVFFKIDIIKSPIVRQVGTYQNHVSGFKLFYTIADELRALTLFKMDQFNFGVVMPAIINVGNKILSYTKRMLGLFGHF